VKFLDKKTNHTAESLPAKFISSWGGKEWPKRLEEATKLWKEEGSYKSHSGFRKHIEICSENNMEEEIEKGEPKEDGQKKKKRKIDEKKE